MSSTIVLSPTTLAQTFATTSITSRSLNNHEPTRETLTVEFKDCSCGLGIKIIGGVNEEGDDRDFGIFIRKVLRNGLAEQNGLLKEGDQVLEVNGENLEQVTNARAVGLLRQATAFGIVRLTVGRDIKAREDYSELIHSYSYPSSVSSRASTPSLHGSHGSWSVPISPTGSNRSLNLMHPSQLSPYARLGNKSPSVAESSSESDAEAYYPSQGELVSPSQAIRDFPESPATFPRHRIPKLGAASLYRPRGFVAPSMSSTPQDINGLKLHSPDVAATMSPGSKLDVFEPSPVLPADTRVMSPPIITTMRRDLSRSPPVLAGQTDDPLPHAEKLSLDPLVRLKVEKLQLALGYLGLDSNPEKEAELNKRLFVAPDGTVTYGEFVKVAKEIFRFELEERNISQGAMFLANNDVRDFLDPPAFRPEMSQISNGPVNEDFQQVRQERDYLRGEVERLKSLLQDRERSCNMAEEELLRIRREAQGAVHESRSLRSKVHLAEQAQRAARSMEQDYEEVVRVLEHEIAELRMQQTKALENPAVQKRLAVLSCQLRKSEVSKRTYEVATEKLLQFAEIVQESLYDQGDSSSPRNARGSQRAKYSSKQKADRGIALGEEAKDVIKAVKSIIEIEQMANKNSKFRNRFLDYLFNDTKPLYIALPFGWDEAYTADGMKYYINHVTQTTNWEHPVTKRQSSISGSTPPPAPAMAGPGPPPPPPPQETGPPAT